MPSRLALMRQQRLDKLAKLRELGFSGYPALGKKTHQAAQISAEFDQLEGQEVTVAGRVMSWREHGQLAFIDLADVSGSVQLYLRADTLADTNPTDQQVGYKDLNLLDTGDIISATGTVTKTKSGQISVQPTQIRLLTKALRPMPDNWEGIKDPEVAFRRRYVDFTVNPARRQLFERKARFWKANRDFMANNGFIEVETPVLEHVTGGADARPFITHMNALDQDFFLRISTELYQKRLIGGGFEKVFTIGPNFRNEGLSDEHLPEYYQIEWYWAYADYRDNMAMVEDMFTYIADQVYGTRVFTKNQHTFDLGKTWEQISYPDVIRERFGLDIFTSPDEDFARVLKEHGIKLDGAVNRQRMIDNVWKIIRKTISGPAFLINEPKFMSPLAKSKPEDPRLTERFHIIIAGSELGNGYSELNDPIDQLERFQEQQAARESGDDEAQMLDIDFVEMLEYGMPPTSGFGMSERVFWFLENVTAREGTIFPTLRHKVEEVTKEIYGMKDQTESPVEVPGFSNEQVEPAVTEKFPGIFFARVEISNVTIKKQDENLEAQKNQVAASKSGITVEDIKNIAPIAAYRELLRATGIDFHKKRPSPEALLRRVVQGKGIYTINTAVDAYNMAVLETGVGLGGFDTDNLQTPVVLRFSRKGEKMKLLGDEKDTFTEAGELVYADQEKPITIDLNYRDISATKITEETKNITLFADGAPGLSEDEVIDALRRGAQYIQQYCGGNVSEVTVVR